METNLSPLDHKETKSKIADLITIKHFFQVPLSYDKRSNQKTKETMTIFARELRRLTQGRGWQSFGITFNPFQ